MATLYLGSVTVEEINRSANNAYAANIISGEIFRVTGRHSKNNNILLAVEGFALHCKSFDGGSFTAEGCILYNPPLIKAIIEACDDSENSLYIVAGTVTKTAPAASTDIVVSIDKKAKKPLKTA